MSSLPDLKVAVVQVTSTRDVQANLTRSRALVERAADAGARLIALPENYGFIGADAEKLPHAQSVEDGPFVAPLREVARTRKIYVLCGSIPERGPDAAHTYNTTVLVGPDGHTVATYRKIHLFDVELSDGFSVRESDSVAPGAQPVVVEVEGWRVGLTICYDLRFPELYRRLGEMGAQVLAIPAAFTLHTGKDHWDTLLRARAIENQCFVVAPGQFGRHGAGRVSWGKSQIIDPWGTVMALCPERESVAVAELTEADLQRARRQIPALSHRRLS